MQADQKYFLLDRSSRQADAAFYFLSVISTLKILLRLLRVMKKVVRPRLSDAEFFFLTRSKNSHCLS